MGKDTTSTVHSNSNRRSGKRKLDEDDDDVDLPKQKSQETANRRRLPARFFPKVDSHSPKSSHRRSPTSGNTQLVPQQVITSRIMSIPVRKIAMIIGKKGDTINYIRKQSGAKIHLPESSKAGNSSDDAKTINATLSGTAEAITKAENLLNALIISEADGGSLQPGAQTIPAGAEIIEMRIPDTMAGLLIGRGGNKIDTIQRQSGAHVQTNPSFLAPRKKSTERTAYISGSPDQIEAAKAMVNEIVSKSPLKNPAVPTRYSQPVFRPVASFQQQQQQIAGYDYRHMQPVYTPEALLQPAHTPEALLQQKKIAGYGYRYRQPDYTQEALLQQQQQQTAGYEDMRGVYPMQSSHHMSYSAEQTSYDQPYPPGVTPQQYSNGYRHFTPQYRPGPDHTYINQSNQGYNQDYYSNQASSYGQQTHPTKAATNQQNPYGAWGIRRI